MTNNYPRGRALSFKITGVVVFPEVKKAITKVIWHLENNPKQLFIQKKL